MLAGVGGCTGAAGSERADLAAMALPRARGLAAASERACCLPAAALGRLLAGASPPAADCLAAAVSRVGSACTGKAAVKEIVTLHGAGP